MHLVDSAVFVREIGHFELDLQSLRLIGHLMIVKQTDFVVNAYLVITCVEYAHVTGPVIGFVSESSLNAAAC